MWVEIARLEESLIARARKLAQERLINTHFAWRHTAGASLSRRVLTIR